MWVCVCQGQARAGSRVSEGLSIKSSSCGHAVHAAYVAAAVGDLGHGVTKNDSSYREYRAALLPQLATDAKDRGAFDLTHKERTLLYPSEYPFERTRRSKNPDGWGYVEEGTKLTSEFECELAEQKSRSWFYQARLKRLQPRSGELPQREVCIGSQSNLSAPAPGASTTFT